eukprot:1241447-Prymnesium_polylepis.1
MLMVVAPRIGEIASLEELCLCGTRNAEAGHDGMQIGDAGMMAFSSEVAHGALSKLLTLELHNNKIGDAGIVSLAAALGKGALPQLKDVFLQKNQIADAGVSALAHACGEGALPQLHFLNLANNL